jgi:AmmeMemoRadiSam system protein B
LLALVAPHAGHIYSGPVAGYAFKAIQGQIYDKVIILSPYHAGHAAPILTSTHDAYSTPLGPVPVDVAALSRLEEALAPRSGPGLTPISHDREHAIEIELPFLQVALDGDFSLLPLMLASIRPDQLPVLAESLVEALDGRTSLLIASTDLSHFYPKETANQLDGAMLEAVASLDPVLPLKVQASGKGEACGLTSVVTVMHAARILGGSQAKILSYATSGVVSGDYRRVVGYGAAAIF